MFEKVKHYNQLVGLRPVNRAELSSVPPSCIDQIIQETLADKAIMGAKASVWSHINYKENDK